MNIHINHINSHNINISHVNSNHKTNSHIININSNETKPVETFYPIQHLLLHSLPTTKRQ